MFNWDDDPDLNITPLMDVMLVLMAILMIAAPTITYQEQITLPQGSKQSQTQKSDTVTIRMDKNKNIYIDNDIYSLETFSSRFTNNSHLDPKTYIYIRADESLPYKDIMFLLKSIKTAGFQNVSLITE
ncbi:MAG: biopolymer transporter ExbD [Sulfurovaceae bacterium]|nr:biopolymer transporter ExbD [Sulfurovaceae bacterium]